MIMMPMTRPAASALSEETSRPIDSPDAADQRGDGQGGEEAVDHGRDAGQDLQDRLGRSRESWGSHTATGRSPRTSRSGPATSMAMTVIRNVPANSGTAPNAPDEPTWSARSAVCGLHCRPNRNSVIGTFWKKRIDFEQHREDDPGGGRDRDAGRQPQGDGDPALDGVAGAELARDVAQRRRQAERRQGHAGDEQRDPAEGQQRAVVVGRGLQGRRDLAGRRQAVGDAPHARS